MTKVMEINKYRMQEVVGLLRLNDKNLKQSDIKTAPLTSREIHMPDELRVIANSNPSVQYIYNKNTRFVYGLYDSKKLKFYYRAL